MLPGDHQPLVRPVATNQVWSNDFVFHRTAEEHVLKRLVIVDAGYDAIAIEVEVEVERAISGLGVTRVLDRLALSCGLPQVIRTNPCCKMRARVLRFDTSALRAWSLAAACAPHGCRSTSRARAHRTCGAPGARRAQQTVNTPPTSLCGQPGTVIGVSPRQDNAT